MYSNSYIRLVFTAGNGRGPMRMEQIEYESREQPAAEPNFEDLRAAPRFALLIRSAKLVCESGEYLCIIRDVSQTGVRLRMFHSLPPDERFALELPTGEQFHVEKVWERGDQAGFRFANSIELERFIAETGPYPKRAVRLRLEFPATIRTDYGIAPAMVRNMSQHGLRIETNRMLALGQKVKLEAEGIPVIFATVCWRANPAYGLVLREVFTFENLAKLAERLQRPNTTSPRAVGGPTTHYL